MKTFRGYEVVECPYCEYGEANPCPYAVGYLCDPVSYCYKDEKPNVCVYENGDLDRAEEAAE